MILELDKKTVEKYINDLMSWDAFETATMTDADGSQILLIPYVMNDAVECLIRLKGGRLTDKGLYYQKAFLEGHCYQYHRIGHSWRTQKGEEHLRRLVNLLCVLHDKHHYLGKQACNAVEESLWPLIEFAPLCYWSPVNDSIESWYPESEAGEKAMLELAQAAGDEAYASHVLEYMELHQSDPSRRWHTISLAKELVSPDHAALFYYLDKKITEASVWWPPRRYPPDKEQKMKKLRSQISEAWKKKGYEGSYPLLKKTDPQADGPQQILFVEEHPFTILEAEDFDFRIHEIKCLP